jgi:hypothetical protein
MPSRRRSASTDAARHVIAPRYSPISATSASAASRETRKWVVRRSCTPERGLSCGRWRPTSHARRGRRGPRLAPRGSSCRRPRAARLVEPRLRNEELSVGYWVDEGLSVGHRRPAADRHPGTLRQDGSPPLYYCLLHIWMLAHEQRRARHAHAVADVRAAPVPLAFWGAGSCSAAAPPGSRRCSPPATRTSRSTARRRGCTRSWCC